MAASEQQRTQQLKPPKAEIADRGVVRLGDGFITAGFPPLRMPKPQIADRGNVRLGDGFISGRFPIYP